MSLLSLFIRYSGLLGLGLLTLSIVACGPDEREDGQPDDSAQTLRWGTSAVGSSGHRAMVNLAAVLNREMEDWDITVLPLPGAIMGLRSFIQNDLNGYYGSNMSFYELANDRDRFAGFRDRIQKEPVQTFWAYTMEMGLAIQAQEADRFSSWSDLNGRGVFTGPRPWDTRAHLERAMRAAGVEHQYVELDLSMTGSQLRTGSIAAIGVYSTAEKDIPPWLAETERIANLKILNPSAEEQAAMREAGLEIVSISTDAFQTDVGVDEILFTPFFYGFHLGLSISEDSVYRMLLAIEKNAADLARSDAVFSQLAEDMPALQARGIANAIDDARIHPGLARYLRERNAWNSDWDSRVAQNED
ncbi:MAG: hypothetical protein JJU20_01670 [Opitutales bacterium]|nr:hypothetical protein [Opitutales bacterium]